MHPRYAEGEEPVVEQLTPVSTRVINSSIVLAQRHRPGEPATPLHILILLIESKHERVLQIFDVLGVNPDRVVVDAAGSILSGVS
jgi:hypothetical protein